MNLSKDFIKEINKNLKTVKSNRPYLTDNQLVATVCVMYDIANKQNIDFAIVESIYNNTREEA